MVTDSGPRPCSDGFDTVGVGDEAVPGATGGGDDGLVAVEDALGKLGLAQVSGDLGGSWSNEDPAATMVPSPRRLPHTISLVEEEGFEPSVPREENYALECCL
jgi:hypothetical protein